MRRTLLVAMIAAAVGVSLASIRVSAQQKLPFLPTTPAQHWWHQQASQSPLYRPIGTHKRTKIDLNAPEPNRDILVTPKLGPWMILVCSYRGEKKDIWARQMVALLRGNDYRLPAYVFNYGYKERIEEEKRIQREVEAYRRRLLEIHRKTGTPLPEKQSFHIRRIPIKEEAGVLIGGYRDMQTARRALDEIRRLKPPDPKKVQLDRAFIAYKDKKTGKQMEKWVWVNPFHRAFVVRNPTIPKEKTSPEPKWDLAALRRMNADETYSLLKCPKKITLAIKEFRTPTIVEQGLKNKGILSSLGFGLGVTRTDNAAISAHNLAELLRTKMGLEAYVLHTKYSSVVTIGGYDSVNDPRLREMQARLRRFLNTNHPVYRKEIGFFTNAWPMKVPR